MSKTLFQDLLATLKRSNKARKLVLAFKAGYPTVEAYKNYLEAQIIGGPSKKKSTVKKTTTEIPTIHIVDVIDCSGSMMGTAIRNAIKGINDGISKLREDKAKVEYTYSLCDFSNDINYSYFLNKLSEVGKVEFGTRSSTSLYDAVGATLRKVQKAINPGDKVLVNIYTDGGDNSSNTFTVHTAGKLIEELKENFTVTFIGTEFEVKNIIRNMKIDASNTLAYDGSAQGLAKTMAATNVARSSYSKGVASGQNVSMGFYKNITNK